MAQTANVGRFAPAVRAGNSNDPSYQAFEILHWGFVAAPVLAGVDKFLRVLANWDVYLAPAFARISPLSVHTTMQVVGVIECVAGVAIAIKPRYGAYIVAAWLAFVILNLAALGNFYDIALRDFGLCLAALALGRLSKMYDQASG